MSAAAITIISSQVPHLTGIVLQESTLDFVDSCKVFFTRFNEIRCGDTLAGVLAIVILTGLKFLGQVRVCRKLFAVISRARYLMLIIVGTFITYAYIRAGRSVPYNITGSVVEGRVIFDLPKFRTRVGNETLEFVDMVEEIGLRVVVIPLVSAMQMFVVAKVFADGQHIRVNQELLTLGLINMAGCFVAAMPTSASFGRTAVNIAAGARSPFSGVITPLAVLLAIYFWSDSFFYIPKPILAGMVVCTMWSLIDFNLPFELWSTKSQ